MSDVPERFWVSVRHNGMVGECWHNARTEKPHNHWEYNEYVRADLIEAVEAENRELALKVLAAQGQAADAHEAQLAAEAKLEQALRTLEEYACSCTDQCSDMQLSCGDAASDTIEKLKGGE